MGSDRTGAFAAIRRQPWLMLLGLLILFSSILLLILGSKIGFFLDDLDLVLGREGSPTDWLLPHNEHIVVLPAAIYKFSLAVFGMNAMPLHVIAVLLFEASVLLLFLWMRPLVGAGASVLGCAVVLFLGAATEDLIWAFQMGFFGSVAGGIGALLLLRRGEKRDDAYACLLLVVSLLFSSLSIPFMAAAAVQILFRTGLRPDLAAFFRRSWVFLVPALLYGIWWLGWGHLTPSALSFDNARRDPIYVLSGLGYGTFVLSGAFKEVSPSGQDTIWALPGLALATLVGTVLFVRRRIPIELLVALAGALSFWILSGLNYIPGREFFNSRYQYPGALFLLMILAGTFAGMRPSRALLGGLACLATVGVALNISALFDGFNNFYRPYSERNAIALTALDIASRPGKPEFFVAVNDAGTALVGSKSYDEAKRKYGSGSLTESEIEKTAPDQRSHLDQILVGALPVQVLLSREVDPVKAECRILNADSRASDTTQIRTPQLYIRSSDRVTIWLGRFGPGANAIAWSAPAGKPIGYQVPRDNSDRPWRIGFHGSGKVTVCPARSGS